MSAAMVITLVFWTAVLALAYIWIGYPVLVASIARSREARPERSREARPDVSVIIAAFNEAGCIGAKLRSTLAQRYPWDRLEVIVVSDGSTDGTDTIVTQYPDPRVRLIRQDSRSGKSVALNRGVAAARGEIVVFTDANAMFARDAIARLAAPFADSRVGLVSGQGFYASTASADARAVSNGYVRYEALIKRAEAALGFIGMADGAIYALRRDLYRDLDAAEVNDLLHPIQAALAGYESRFDPDAYTVEPPSTGGGQEWGRHVRIIAQGVHIVRWWLPRLCRAGHLRAAWMLVSHRVLRWTSAPLLVIAFAANVVLARDATIYVVTLAAQLAFYVAALVGFVGERLRVPVGRLAVPYYFCVVNAAGIGGIVRFFHTGAQAVWKPTGQTRVSERAA